MAKAGDLETIVSKLNAIESSDLRQHEATIERGMESFVEVGTALAAIRDGKLYRAKFDTFEAYCQERWKLTRQYCNRLIEAAKVVDNLETMVSKPTAERQARELSKAPPKERAEVWEEAVEKTDGKPTAAAVKAAVAAREPKPAKSGKQKFDPREFERIKTAIGGIARAMDNLNRSAPGPKFNVAGQALLTKLVDNLDDWRKFVR